MERLAQDGAGPEGWTPPRPRDGSAPAGPAGTRSGRQASGAAPREGSDADERRRAQAVARAQRAAARAAARAMPPRRRPELAHLDLPALRAYRQTLLEQEDSVSYWRRILQARLDTLSANGRDDGPLQRRALVRGRMGTGGMDLGRTALVTVVPADGIPPLPDLERLWRRAAGAAGHVDERHLAELGAAERQLSDYRNALHERLAVATGELIARYHEDPTLCFAALPLAGTPGRPAAR